MSGPQKGKSGALDAFWDTYSSTSNTSGSMSDLLSTLPGSSGPLKAPKRKMQPPGRPAETPPAVEKADPISLIVTALFAADSKAMSVSQLMKQTGMGPSELLETSAKAKDLGLIVETGGADGKSFKLTSDGIAWLQ